MPIYEYACQKCGHVVEVMQKFTDPPPRKCERCGGRLARVMSQSSFQLKGGGWYKDLYSSTGGKKSGEKAETKSAEPKAEKAKPAADSKK
ncbi:MAG TPA: zinc ribbon domain-containing protein [Myxococcales bacterium]|jgi:putative FmdB family regulatory protein|nr:zinc ribbon domain-containing protein [Myxococcales bacterium]